MSLTWVFINDTFDFVGEFFKKELDKLRWNSGICNVSGVLDSDHRLEEWSEVSLFWLFKVLKKAFLKVFAVWSF